MADWKILLVEDDPDGQQVVERMLRHNRIEVNTVGSAEDALDALATGEQYTAAILDLALPGMDGWTLLGRIQRDTNMPCVAITAYHSADLAVKAIKAGFVAYFPKPLDMSFVRELQRALTV
ncbi:MAG: response regulator [Anaerolineae bacterium]|nr:response regulator [Anaerolineae bacterium]